LTQLNQARLEFDLIQIQLESASRNIIFQAGIFALSQVNEHIGDTVKNVLLKI